MIFLKFLNYPKGFILPLIIINRKYYLKNTIF